MKKTVFLFLGLLAAVSLLPGEEKKAWTLPQIFTRVLQENETVLSAVKEIEKARVVHRSAYSRLIPSANFSAGLTRYGEELTIDLGEDGSFEVIPQTDWTYGVHVRQILYAGGRPRRGLKYAANLEKLSRKSFVRVRQEVLLQVAAAYIEILKAMEDLEISRKSHEMSARRLITAESLFRAGETARTAVLRAKVSVAGAERDIILSENFLAKAREYFSLLTSLRGDYELTPIEEPELPEKSLEELIRLAARHREEMEMIRLELLNTDLNIRIRKGERFPVLTADFNYIRQKSEFPADRWYNFVIGFSVPIFDGGVTASRVEIARQEKEQVVLRKSELEKSIRSEVTDAFLNLQDVLRALDVVASEVAFAGLNYEDTKNMYSVGEATSLDMLDAEKSLINAERLSSILKNDRILANFSLQNSTGIFARDRIQEGNHNAP